MRKRIVAIALGAVVAGLVGCQTPDLKSVCRIEAARQHRPRIAKFVSGSRIWKAYFKQIKPSKPVVEFSLTMDRKTRKSRGGDYDPGTVIITFAATNLKNGQSLYTRDSEVELESFMVGLFDKEATREQIQEIVFKATEEKVFPYLDRWVDLAGLRAMGQEAGSGSAFVPLLSELAEDNWSSFEVRNEAKDALAKIRGS